MQNRGRTIAKHLQGSGSGRACYIHVMLAVARKVCSTELRQVTAFARRVPLEE